MELNDDLQTFFKILLRKLNFSSSIADGYLVKLIKNNTIKDRRFADVTNIQAIIQELYDELELKMDSDKITLKDDCGNDYFTASDVASLVFCPASFSISRSFDVQKIKNKISINVGQAFHAKHLLLNLDSQNINRYRYETNISDKVWTNISKIRRCENLYIDNEGETKIFKNGEYGFWGRPDYLFRDPNNNIFVVEEKFSVSGSKVYDNHLAQLSSYIKYITDYPIRYGILINWEFKYEGLQPMLKNSSTTMVNPNEREDVLNNSVNTIKKLRQSNSVIFDRSSINPSKCAGCSVRLYCGHKTGKIEQLKFPYSLDYLRLSDEKLYETTTHLDLMKVTENF